MATKTATRLKYEASQRNQATMAQVETILEAEAIKVLDTASNFSQQEMGGFLRTVIPALVDRYGNVNAVAAMKYYDEQRLIWQAQANLNARKAQRVAAAKLKSAIYVAKMPSFNSVTLADPIVGYSMSRFMAEGFGVMREQAVSAMTRAVGSYNRDTILYNAGLDDATLTVQRVAEPNACAFCAMLAFSSTRSVRNTGSDVRTASYAIEFHDRCRCSIETLYEGDEPIRPDYYDQFEQDYTDATAEVSGSLTSKAVLAEIRKQSGRS